MTQLSQTATRRQLSSEAASLARDYVTILDAMIDGSADGIATAIDMLDQSEADLAVADLLVFGQGGDK